ncbi:MAG: hypothetical protein ACRDTT_17175 [Pseudonocardiaceae bacterium]
MSRLETGRQLPPEDDLRIWALHTGASQEQTEPLINMLSAARVDYIPTADLVQRGALALRQAPRPDRTRNARSPQWLAALVARPHQFV